MAGYICTYKAIPKNSLHPVIERYLTTCFVGVYDNISDYDTIIMYSFKNIKEDFNPYKIGPNMYYSFNDNIYTKKELVKYVKILNKLGNCVTLTEGIYSPQGYPDRKHEVYIYTIKNINNFVTKMMLAFIRFTYEREYYRAIPKALMSINKEFRSMHILNKMILSCYASYSLLGGHDIIGNKYKKLFKRKDADKFIEDNKDTEINIRATLANYEMDGNPVSLSSDYNFSNIMKSNVREGYNYYKQRCKEIVKGVIKPDIKEEVNLPF